MLSTLLWLRNNVTLPGDIALAEIELQALLPGRTLERRESNAALQGPLAAKDGATAGSEETRSVDARLLALNSLVTSNCYAVSLSTTEIERVLTRATFVQIVVAIDPENLQRALVALAAAAPRLRRWQAPLFVALTDQCAVELASLVAAGTAAGLSQTIATLLGDPCTEQERGRSCTLTARPKASAYLTHDLHVYKAKFFPRLARAALNLVLGAEPPAGRLVLDPFAGSGTALLEAARLDAPSLGADIDPLSVLIARGKLLLPRLDAARLRAPLDAGHFERPAPGAAPKLELPPWLTRKLAPEVRLPLLAEVDALASAVASLPAGPERAVAALCLSDALTRKLRMRFLGTGVGRFALEPARQPVRALFLRAYRALCVEVASYQRLSRDYGLCLDAPAGALRADARLLPLPDASVGAVLTSPPYLPASSGRENYLLGKAPSLLLLGLLDPDELRGLDQQATGSMGAASPDPTSCSPHDPALKLSAEELRLVDWLAADPLRAIKAEPVRRYFHDLRRSLRELRRVLRPGGRAAVVVGTHSTFYRYATRETLYRVETASLFAEAAHAAGFSVTATIEVELDKGNRNARPRSLDTYSETIVVLKA